MSAGKYRIKVIGELDATQIKKDLDDISKTPLKVNGVLGGVGASADKATKGVKRLNGAIADTSKQTKKVHTRQVAGTYKGIGKQAEKSTSKLKAFGAETLHVTKKVVQFGAITDVIRGVTTGLGDMVQNVFELDSALTEFKKVSNLTGKELEKYTDQAYKAGRETARTGTEMIDAAT